MGGKWRGVFIAALVIALVIGSVGSIAAAPVDNPGKGPPDFDKIVFVHYPKGEAPGKPPGTPGKGPREGDYVYDGYHWADDDIPVHYLVNLAGNPGTFRSGIEAAFQTWEAEPNSYMDFECDGSASIGMSSLNDEMDGYNVVGWANISEDYPNAIAVTIFWYNVLTKEVVEVDVAMNSNPDFAWWRNPGGEKWVAGDDPDAFDVDVQNIMTHEAGHWLVLDDLYADENSEKTMYGYADEFELKKRSLDPGDEAGIQAVYPVTEAAPTEGTMHVAAIDMWYDTKGPNYFIYTRVTIRDADGAAVPEATVYLEMTLPGGSKASGSGDTNGQGTVTFKLKSRQSATYTSNVTNVAKDGWSYDEESSVTSASIPVE